MFDVAAIAQNTGLNGIAQTFKVFGQSYPCSRQPLLLDEVAALLQTIVALEFAHDHWKLSHFVETCIALTTIEKDILFT